MIRIILEKVLQIGGLEVLLNRVLFFRIIEDIAPEKTEEYKWLIQNYDTLNLRHIYEDCFNESEKLNLYIANISEDFLRRNKPSDTGIIKQKTENKVNKKCTNINTTNSHTQGQKGNVVAKSSSFGMLNSSQSVQKSKTKQVDVIDRKSSCGKGRVDFFLSYQTKAKTIGIEYDERIYQGASNNLMTAVSRRRAEMILAKAETYEVPAEVNRCYFFNPFSVEILRKVMARILESYYEEPREILLFFYYPSEEYISYLMTVDELSFYDEISCEDLFEENNSRERIMIFEMV